ncbi:hypothetical protein DY240_21575 [Jiangella rhizosphaerae]|uniref:Uncharacterized protein n=1 Tax=Jiangella rhizosphaerae TaxID=2293569 RepID=A0A418KKR7_9ACTN|nr:hypothetical protein DY240_21575 [Jiangella rhizosphaerae]
MLGGLVLARCDDDTTSLTGAVTDQTQLHGVLATIRDLGVPLMSLGRDWPGNGEDRWPSQTSRFITAGHIRCLVRTTRLPPLPDGSRVARGGTGVGGTGRCSRPAGGHEIPQTRTRACTTGAIHDRSAGLIRSTHVDIHDIQRGMT